MKRSKSRRGKKKKKNYKSKQNKNQKEKHLQTSNNYLPLVGLITATRRGAHIPLCPSVIQAVPLNGAPASGAWFSAVDNFRSGPAAATAAQAHKRHAAATWTIAARGGRYSRSCCESLSASRSVFFVCFLGGEAEREREKRKKR